MSVEATVEKQAQHRALARGAGWGLRVCPMTVKAAGRWMGSGDGRKHRHNNAPQGGLFAAGLMDRGQLVGVVIVGRPVARLLDDGQTAEVTRVCTLGTKNACSMLYGAAARAAKALGYTSIITYTLASEPGVSLRAAGWTPEHETRGEATNSRPSRPRVQRDLLGEEMRPTEDKIRWRKQLAPCSPDQLLRAPNVPDQPRGK